MIPFDNTFSGSVSSPPESPEGGDHSSQKMEGAKILGEMVYLLTKSSAHQFLFLNDLDWLIIPPLAFGQYYIFRNQDKTPVGFAVWAFVNEEVDRRLTSFIPRLSPNEWRSGTIPWVVELVAPYGKDEVLLDHLRQVLEGGNFKMAGTDSEGEPHVVQLS